MEFKCELCELVKGDVKTRLYFEDDLLVCVDCLSCGVPMAVFKQHREPNETELALILFKVKDVFRNKEIDFGRRKIMDHFHIHLR